MPRPQEAAQPKNAISHDEIRRETLERFGFVPCLWQIRVVEAILKHDHDVVSMAATGSGKTLTFWMPLLFREGGIQIVISPLNLLFQPEIPVVCSRMHVMPQNAIHCLCLQGPGWQ